MFGLRIGKSTEVNSNRIKDEEIIMSNLYSELASITIELNNFSEWYDIDVSEKELNNFHIRLLVKAERLKAILSQGGKIMSNRNMWMPIHTLADSIDVSLFVIEGVTYKDSIISNNFFEDGKIDESEQLYVVQLSEDYTRIYEEMRYVDDGIEKIIGMEKFLKLIEPFCEKYDHGDSFYKLKVDN